MAGGPNVPEDQTPIIGAAKRPHERTTDEGLGAVNWHALAASEKFRALLSAKRRFVIPALIFFILYYFALLILVGYARSFMEQRVLGAINLAYLFALSQFFMAWIIAALYVRAAMRFDKMAQEIRNSNLAGRG